MRCCVSWHVAFDVGIKTERLWLTSAELHELVSVLLTCSHFPVKQERVHWHHMKKLFCLFQMSAFPSGDLLSTKWQCPQVMHYSAATWGPQMCCGSSLQDVLCPGNIVPLFSFYYFWFVLIHLARKGRSQCTGLTWTWGIILKDPPISHSVFSSWEEQGFSLQKGIIDMVLHCCPSCLECAEKSGGIPYPK